MKEKQARIEHNFFRRAVKTKKESAFTESRNKESSHGTFALFQQVCKQACYCSKQSIALREQKNSRATYLKGRNIVQVHASRDVEAAALEEGQGLGKKKVYLQKPHPPPRTMIVSEHKGPASKQHTHTERNIFEFEIYSPCNIIQLITTGVHHRMKRRRLVGCGGWTASQKNVSGSRMAARDRSRFEISTKTTPYGTSTKFART